MSVATTICPSCGGPLARTDERCPRCGEPVAAGERKLLTLLFADLAGYTALAKTLDPEDVHAFLRPAMTALRLVVEDFGGVVPLVMGDGFMAVFGVPAAHEDDAERAVRAALAIRDRVERLNAERPAGVRVPPVHSGVNSGIVLVAPSREPLGYDLTGDAVNTASRLGGIAKGGQVLVGERTRELTDHVIRYGPHRTRRVKGKPEGVATFEALGARDAGSEPFDPRTAEMPFLDRRTATERLRAELREVRRSKRSRVLIVEGEPGIGKSRLAAAFRSSLRGVTWLPGRCPPYGQHLPLFAVADAVRWVLDLPSASWRETDVHVRERAEPLVRGDAERFLRQVRVLTGEDERAAPRAMGTSEDTAPAARVVIEGFARRRPVVVEIDDLQWADPDLLELIVDAHEEPWDVPVLFLGLARGEMPAPFRDLPTIRIDPLPAREMSELADAVVGDRLPVDVAESLLGRAGGNPLFLQEGVRMLVESGALRAADGVWRIEDPLVLARVPETLRALIAARLDGLDRVEKAVLQDAAVCGERVPPAALDHLRGEPVQDAIRRLVARDLLRRSDDGSLSFRHGPVRDVAYGTLPRAERASRHLMIGEWLRDRGEADPARLAHHFEQAWLQGRSKAAPGGDAEAAAAGATWLVAAGEAAFAHQPAVAEDLFARAAAAARAAGDDGPLAVALAGRAESLIELGEHRSAAREAGKARRLAVALGRDDLRARALLALGRQASDMSDVVRAKRLLQEALGLFEAAGDEQGRAWTLHRLSEAARFEAIPSQVAPLRAALPLFELAGDRWGRATVMLDLAYVLSVVGGPDYREAAAAAETLAKERGDARTRANVLRTQANHAYFARRFDAAIRAARLARPLGREAGDRWLEVEALLIEAQAIAASRPAAESEPLVADLLEIADLAGARRLRAVTLLAGTRSSLAAGRPVQARRRLNAARAILEELGAEPELAEADLVEAGLFRAAGRMEAASDAADRAAARAGMYGFPLLRRWAEAARAAT